MGRRFTVLLVIAVASACSLFTDLGDLGTDASTDVVVPQDSSSPDVTPDVTTSDVVDAASDGCPTITRTKLQSNGKIIPAKTAQVTIDQITQGDLLVAVLGAQFDGFFNISDSASNAWTMPNGQDNYACVSGDAAPWATRTRIAYTTVLSTTANDVITFTLGGANDYLALVVAEYHADKPLAYVGTEVGVADGSVSGTVSTKAFTTNACSSVIVAMLGDEYPVGDVWTPFVGFQAIAAQSDWAYVAVDDTAVPPGTIAPGATHTTPSKCWAATAAAFSPQ
jgi:hypothetical protein